MKKQSDLSRLMGYAGNYRYFTYASWVLSAVSALVALVPFVYIWKILRDVLNGERPVVHIAVVCGFNRKFFKQCNSQQRVCDMQFTVVANKSNCELRWQGASYSGAHPVFVFMETHAVPYATSGSLLRTPSAVVSYKTHPANLARTSQFCVPSELFHLPSSASFNTSCPAQTCGNQ